MTTRAEFEDALHSIGWSIDKPKCKCNKCNCENNGGHIVNHLGKMTKFNIYEDSIEMLDMTDSLSGNFGRITFFFRDLEISVNKTSPNAGLAIHFGSLKNLIYISFYNF